MSLRRRAGRQLVRPDPFSSSLSHTFQKSEPTPRSPQRPTTALTERSILLTLTIAALFTRFIRLSHPNAVVFDEFHFGNFLEKHLRHEISFDIHPWLGKLTLAFFAWLGGFHAHGFDYQIRKVYPNNDYLLVRAVSAFFGSLCVPLMYLVCRELRIGITSSVLGALLPLLDSLLLIESRLILTDSQLMFYLNLTLLCALRFWNAAETKGVAGGRKYYAYLLATAVSGALAVSIKWTAAVTPFLVVVVCGLGVWFLRTPTPIYDCALAAVVALVVYLVPWWFHLKLSRVSTEMAVHFGDRFRSTLQGNETFPYDPSNNMRFAEKVWELHWRQFRANQKVKTRHVWESRWYEWPLNLRGIYYYVDKADSWTDERPMIRVVYLLQNPAMALWVFGGVTGFSLLLPIVHRYRRMTPENHVVTNVFHKGSFLLAGYLTNLLPYMLVERCYFLYHYLPALTYGQLLTVFLVDSLPKTARILVTVLMGVSIVAAFVFWAPWTYCLPIDFASVKQRQWMPRWN